jgi:hypothetical protein
MTDLRPVIRMPGAFDGDKRQCPSLPVNSISSAPSMLHFQYLDGVLCICVVDWMLLRIGGFSSLSSPVPR